jgi:hypothetical protein
MNPHTQNTGGIPGEILSDAEALVEAAMAGKKPDPELARRVRERGARVTEDIRKKHGVLNIGTQIIRELRDA